MALKSEPRFRVHHAVRIKGMSAFGHLVDLSGVSEREVTSGLDDLHGRGLAKLFEARGLWSLTPAGREAHAVELEIDAGRPGFREGLARMYPQFLELNNAFKALCGDWQLRDGAPNDHGDSSYDRRIVNRLAKLDVHMQEAAKHFGDTAERFAPYRTRLSAARSAFEGGKSNMFTGVLCGSYHDVWMELHEDLILTQKIDRRAEGSF
jgi:hypothetical protein